MKNIMAGKRGTRGKRERTTKDPKSTTIASSSRGGVTSDLSGKQLNQFIHLTHSPSTQPQKKAKTLPDLTAAQEDDLASWLEVNDLIYNKKVIAFKDFRKNISVGI